MPELPEVETIVRGLREPLIGRTVQAMWYDWPKTLHSPAPEEFAARIIGQTFRAIGRRAKYIVCVLDQDSLIVHLKMTGRLYVVPSEASVDADRWLHFRLDLDNGTQLRFSDARKFGRIYLTSDVETVTGGIGPEPLDAAFTAAEFSRRLRSRSRMIKALLLDQTFIAGVGNIYADEGLFRAGINPLRRTDDLSDDEIERLFATVRDSLSAGIDYEGASVNWYRKPDGSRGESQNHFYVYGRDGAPCLICQHPIVKARVAQRGTHYCPNCQPVDMGNHL